MNIFTTGLLLMLISLGHAQSTEKSITEFSRNDANTGILIDVRTPQEYRAGHIETAVNIDWFSADFSQRILDLSVDTSDTLYLYCKKGGRSAKAARKLDSLGYENVVNLLGGFDEYRSKER